VAPGAGRTASIANGRPDIAIFERASRCMTIKLAPSAASLPQPYCASVAKQAHRSLVGRGVGLEIIPTVPACGYRLSGAISLSERAPRPYDLAVGSSSQGRTPAQERAQAPAARPTLFTRAARSRTP
jgi:hypothetical protein